MKKLLLIFFLACAVQQLHCQQADSIQFEPKYRRGIKYVFKTTAGTVFKGFVSDETADFVTVQNREAHETYELRKSEILNARIYADRESYEDISFGENYHARSYMFAGSAFLLRDGKIGANSHWLVLENLDYGFNEHWGITATTIAFYPVSVGVKCAYAVGEQNYLGGNIFGIGNLGSSGGSALYGYGAMAKFTRGTGNNNFTVFGGLLGLNSEVFTTVSNRIYVNTGFMGMGYCKRISRRVAVNAEGWYFPTAGSGLGGLGVKFVGDESISWSFGCYTFFTQDNNTIRVSLKSLPIPYIGVSRNFN